MRGLQREKRIRGWWAEKKEMVTSLDLPFFFLTPCSSAAIGLLSEATEGKLCSSGEPSGCWWDGEGGGLLLEREERMEDGRSV